MGVWYSTREEVKLALDEKETARSDALVDRAIESSGRSVEGLLRRRFYPLVATRYFDWPQPYGRAWRLWLDSNEVISVNSLVVAGITVSASDYFLRRSDDVDEPPYTHIEIDLDSSAAFSSAGTHQRAIALGAVYGSWAEEAPAGTLAEALDSSETAVDVSDSAAIGVGHIIKVDSERMLVTGKSMLDTGQNTGGSLTANTADVTVTVSTGSAYSVGETILVDAERMLIVDIAGNSLIVKRAWDGSVLATHNTAADVYAQRTLTVTRGALGTTAATHSSSTAITKHVPPGLVRELSTAESMNTLLQQRSGYSRTVGEGESERESTGRGLRDIRADALAAYGRRARTRAV